MFNLLPSSDNVYITQALVNFDSKFDMSKLEVMPKKVKKATPATGDVDAMEVEEDQEEKEDIHGRGE